MILTEFFKREELTDEKIEQLELLEVTLNMLDCKLRYEEDHTILVGKNNKWKFTITKLLEPHKFTLHLHYKKEVRLGVTMEQVIHYLVEFYEGEQTWKK